MMLAIAIHSCTPVSTNQPLTLTVSAAASLQNALTDITPLFEQTHPNINMAYNSGGSGTLQRQIEQGAPADLFFSASSQQMDALAEQNLIQAASRQNILSNQLVLITPLDSSIKGFEDLSTGNSPSGQSSNFKTLAVGEFQSVPAGQYAQATLKALDLLPEIDAKLVFFNNVRAVLAAVASGNASAGMVYATDARLSDQVEVVAIAPLNAHPPIRYPIAILQRSAQPAAARQYIDFLTTPAATQVFQRFGFTAP